MPGMYTPQICSPRTLNVPEAHCSQVNRRLTTAEDAPAARACQAGGLAASMALRPIGVKLPIRWVGWVGVGGLGWAAAQSSSRTAARGRAARRHTNEGGFQGSNKMLHCGLVAGPDNERCQVGVLPSRLLPAASYRRLEIGGSSVHGHGGHPGLVGPNPRAARPLQAPSHSQTARSHTAGSLRLIDMAAGLLAGRLQGAAAAAAAAARPAGPRALPARPPRQRCSHAAAAAAGAAGSPRAPEAGDSLRRPRARPPQLALDRGTTDRHKALNAQLCAAETAEQLLQLVERQLPALNITNAVTGFHRIAKVGACFHLFCLWPEKGCGGCAEGCALCC